MKIKEYYIHLSRVQNKHTDQDIMTITGFMNPLERVKHLLRYAVSTQDQEAISYCNQSEGKVKK